METEISDLWLNAFVCVVGLLLHLALKWSEHRNDVAEVGLTAYLKTVPAQTTISVLAAVGAFTVAWGIDWMNPGMSFACGYMGNSIAENMAKQFAGGGGGKV